MRKLENLTDRKEKFWNISAETGQFLNNLMREAKVQTALEIGTSNGYSGLWFAEALSHTKGKLYTVESHYKRFLLAQETFQEAGVNAYVEQIYGHAPEIFMEGESEVKAKYKKEGFGNLDVDFKKDGIVFDFIFLDATKMEYASYFEVLMPFLRSGGLLVADNIISHKENVQDFLQLVKDQKNLVSEVVSMGTGLLIAKKS